MQHQTMELLPTQLEREIFREAQEVLNVQQCWGNGTFHPPVCLLDRFRFNILKKPNRPTEIIPDFGRPPQ